MPSCACGQMYTKYTRLLPAFPSCPPCSVFLPFPARCRTLAASLHQELTCQVRCWPVQQQRGAADGLYLRTEVARHYCTVLVRTAKLRTEGLGFNQLNSVTVNSYQSALCYTTLASSCPCVSSPLRLPGSRPGVSSSLRLHGCVAACLGIPNPPQPHTCHTVDYRRSYDRWILLYHL
jgi:hypothetical protein